MKKEEIKDRIQTINTELSNKGYTITDIESFWNDCLSEVNRSKIKDDLEDAKNIHGVNYTYELKKGTSVDLSKLKKGQRVCASKIKGHHILMTKTK